MLRVFAAISVTERECESGSVYVCVCVAAEKPSNCRLSHVCHINSTLDWRRSTEQVKNYYYLAAAPSTAPSTPYIPPSVAPSGNHSLTQPLSTSSALAQVSVLAPEFVNPSALCFFVEILWATVQVSLFSFLRERERETGVGGREVGQMDRAARKNFFWQRCSFSW